jgi:hypothetical protein
LKQTGSKPQLNASGVEWLSSLHCVMVEWLDSLIRCGAGR